MESMLFRGNALRAISSGVTNAVIYMVFAGVFGLATIYIDNEWMEAEDVLKVFFPLMYSIIGLVQTQTWAADRSKARDAVTKIFNTIDRVPSIDVRSDQGEEVADLQGGLEFRYPARPEVVVLRGLSLVVEAETTAAFG